MRLVMSLDPDEHRCARLATLLCAAHPCDTACCPGDLLRRCGALGHVAAGSAHEYCGRERPAVVRRLRQRGGSAPCRSGAAASAGAPTAARHRGLWRRHDARGPDRGESPGDGREGSQPRGWTYHPKIYLFDGSSRRGVIGSANLTGGLVCNVEAGLWLDTGPALDDAWMLGEELWKSSAGNLSASFRSRAASRRISARTSASRCGSDSSGGAVVSSASSAPTGSSAFSASSSASTGSPYTVLRRRRATSVTAPIEVYDVAVVLPLVRHVLVLEQEVGCGGAKARVMGGRLTGIPDELLALCTIQQIRSGSADHSQLGVHVLRIRTASLLI